MKETQEHFESNTLEHFERKKIGGAALFHVEKSNDGTRPPDLKIAFVKSVDGLKSLPQFELPSSEETQQATEDRLQKEEHINVRLSEVVGTRESEDKNIITEEHAFTGITDEDGMPEEISKLEFISLVDVIERKVQIDDETREIILKSLKLLYSPQSELSNEKRQILSSYEFVMTLLDQQENRAEAMKAYERAKSVIREILTKKGIADQFEVSIVERSLTDFNHPTSRNALALDFVHIETGVACVKIFRPDIQYIEGNFQTEIEANVKQMLGQIKEKQQHVGGLVYEEIHEKKLNEYEKENRSRLEMVERIKQIERQMTPEEIVMVENANNISNAVRAEYGLKAINCNNGVMHIVPGENWIGSGSAFFSRDHNAMVFPEPKSMRSFQHQLVHEMLHYKGVNWMPIALTEAIVERLTTTHIRHKANTVAGLDFLTYQKEQHVLETFMQKIVMKSKGEISNSEQAFYLFAKAHLSGSTQSIEILNKYFGRNVIKELDKVDNTFSSLKTFVDNL